MRGSTESAISASRGEVRIPLPTRSATRIASTCDDRLGEADQRPDRPTRSHSRSSTSGLRRGTRSDHQPLASLSSAAVVSAAPSIAPTERGARAEHGGQEDRQQRIGHLARHVGQEADRGEREDVAAEAGRGGMGSAAIARGSSNGRVNTNGRREARRPFKEICERRGLDATSCGVEVWARRPSSSWLATSLAVASWRLPLRLGRPPSCPRRPSCWLLRLGASSPSAFGASFTGSAAAASRRARPARAPPSRRRHPDGVPA